MSLDVPLLAQAVMFVVAFAALYIAFLGDSP